MRGLQQWVRAPSSWARSVLWALAAVALATLTRYLLGLIEPAMAPYALYFPAVLLASMLGGWRGGAIASLLSVAVAVGVFLPAVPSVSSSIDIINIVLVLVSLASVVAAAGFARTLFMRLEASNARLAEQNLNYDALFQTMSEGFALCEATGLFGLVVAFILMFGF